MEEVVPDKSLEAYRLKITEIGLEMKLTNHIIQLIIETCVRKDNLILTHREPKTWIWKYLYYYSPNTYTNMDSFK